MGDRTVISTDYSGRRWSTTTTHYRGDGDTLHIDTYHDSGELPLSYREQCAQNEIHNL